MAFNYLSLGSNADWKKLEDRLAVDQANPHIAGVIATRLRELGALSVLVEDDYLDRDFSEAYSAYYSTTFRRHSKLCTRLLFFADDISFVNTTTDAEELSNQLEASSFLGQVVLRPISQAPVSHALLAAPPAPANHEGYLLVRSKHTSHVWGAELSVEGVPMTQQDSRVGACAQATIWVAARHFHHRHRGPWLSTVSITRAALAQSEAHTNLMLPAGSESLTVNNMVAALRGRTRAANLLCREPSGLGRG